MTGNVLFHDPLPPAVIDIAPYWRPAEFATAIIVVDSIVWEGADDTLMESVINTEQMYQLLLRATIRRIMELDGIHKQFAADCLDQIDAYEHLVTLLSIQGQRLEAQYQLPPNTASATDVLCRADFRSQRQARSFPI